MLNGQAGPAIFLFFLFSVSKGLPSLPGGLAQRAVGKLEGFSDFENS